MTGALRSRLGLGVSIVVCCALAAAPLAFTPIFMLDWVNHGWYAAYVGHALRADWAVPMFVSTSALVGNPVLVFYGTALYVALSPFVGLFGPELGMRLAAFAALVVPGLAMARFFLALGLDRLTTGCLTICLSSSVYQLTNLYTRGAVTEFFAYQFLLLGMVVLLSVFVGEGPQRAASKLVLGFASLALGALAHPPTFAAAGLFLLLPVVVLGIGILPGAMTSIRRQPLAWAVAATTLVPVSLWLQITIAHRAALAITQQYSGLFYFPLSIDHWVARFWPFSIDFRVLTDGYNLGWTPFLSAPINSMALLLVVLAISGRYLRPLLDAGRNPTFRIFVAAASLAIVAPLLLSLPIVPTQPTAIFPGAVRALPTSATGQVLGAIQFAYRLVNIVNLAAILAVLGISLLRSQTNRDRLGWQPLNATWRYILLATAAVSTAAICGKVLEVHLEFALLPRINQQITPLRTTKITEGVEGMYANGIRGWASTEAIELNRLAMRTVDKIPASQYGIGGYAMPDIYQRYVENSDRDQLGATLKMVGHSTALATAKCPRRCALLTNLVASRWGTVTIDGRPVPPEQLAVRTGALLAIFTEPGTHQIKVHLGSWQTSALSWSILWLVLLFWGSGLVVLVTGLATGPSSSLLAQNS